MLGLARFLQLLGIAEVGHGFFVGLVEENIRWELIHGAIGGAIFYLGWWIQKRMPNP